MNGRILFVAFFGVALLLYMGFYVALHATVRQSLAAGWTVVVAVCIGSMFESGYTDAAIWRIRYAGEPAAQSRFIRQLAGMPDRSDACSLHVDAVQWRAEFESATILSGNDALFLRLHAGPSLVVTNASLFDFKGNLLRSGSAMFDQAKEFRPGETLWFTGQVSAPNPCETLQRDSSGDFTVNVALTSIEPGQQPALGSIPILAILWLAFCLPAWVAVWLEMVARARRPVDVPEPPDGAPALLVPIKPGRRALPIQELIEQYDLDVAAGQTDQAEQVLQQIETAQPADEDQWRRLSGFFRKIGRPSLNEIVTERFLAQEPENVDARLGLANSLAHHSLHHPRVRVILKDIASRSDLGVNQLCTLADNYRMLRMPTEAVASLRRAVACEPTNPLARRRLVALLLESGSHDEARLEFAGFLETMPQTALEWIHAAEIAARLGDRDLLCKYGDMAAARIGNTNSALRRRLLLAFVKGEEFQRAESLMTEDVFAAHRDVKEVMSFITLAEGSGLVRGALFGYRRLLALEPENGHTLSKIVLLERLDRT